VFDSIKTKLRHLLDRKWQDSQAALLQAAVDAGLTEEEIPLFMAGFRHGYWKGAGDLTEIKLQVIQQERQRSPAKIH
jgi:hypothetical protein